MKTKNVLSIVLLILLTTLTFTMIPIPIANAGTYDLTFPGYFCQECGNSFAGDIWFGGSGVAHHHTTTWTATGLSHCVNYEIRIRAVVECPICGEMIRAKTEWTTSPPDGKITWKDQGAGNAVHPTDGPVPAYKYQIHVSDDEGPTAVSATPLYGRAGPQTDMFRAKVIKSPDAQLLAMKEERGDILDGMIRAGDIEDLDSLGFTVTSTPGFHMGHIGYNIRPDQSYKTKTNPDAAYVLSDVNFRHACFHLYNQMEIVSSIYGYVVTAVQSLVPPVHAGWVNPEVPLHPYSPGVPTDTTQYDPVTKENADACSILRYGGYLYSETANNWVTPYDIDKDGTPGTTYDSLDVDAFIGGKPGWIKVGAMPWLDKNDGITAYVHSSTNGDTTGDYTFENCTIDGILMAVELRIVAKQFVEDGDDEVVWHLTKDNWITEVSGAFRPGNTWTTKDFDVSNYITTCEEKNNTKAYLEYSQIGDVGTKLGVTYMELIDKWITDIDDVVPSMQLWTPTMEVAPTSCEHGARFITALHDHGLTSIAHVPREFDPYMDDVSDLGDFDMYMVFWQLSRFPDHLYTMCHSDHDCVKVPGDYNYPGCNDPELDEAVFTIISSLDHDEKIAAAYKAQEILYSEDYPDAAFSYMQLYSRILFDSCNPDLRGIVNSAGYGIKTGWTDLNMHWLPGQEELTPEGKTIIEWIWGEEPELLNPCSASTVYAWDIMDRCLDGLIGVNPYTHEDKPWMATDWEIQKWATEKDVNKLLQNIITVTNESLGFGDGEKTVFNLENCHIVADSETVYLNNTAQTKPENYTIDDTAGEITFTTAPSEYTWINADYQYVYLLGAGCVGSHWHEDWPKWSTNWYMTSWTDTDLSGTLTIHDQVDFDDGPEYHVLDMTWDIKVENKSYPYNEMKLSGIDLPRPPTEIPWGMIPTTVWHEEWPERSIYRTCTDYEDNGDGFLSRSDQIQFDDGFWYHVDSVTVTLHLDKKPIDLEIDKVMEFAGTGMKVLFWLRDDVFWQDGNVYVAEDAVFNWLFLRDNRIPRYKGMWQFLEDAVAVTDFKVVAYMNITSQFLIYDLAGLAALLPPPVWGWLDGRPLNEIMTYDPGNNHTDPDSDPNETLWFGKGQHFPDTQLYGTGYFVFEYYEPILMVADLCQFAGYHKTTEEVTVQKAEMFHKIGDVTWDGYIDVFDLSTVGIAYGKRKVEGENVGHGDGVETEFRLRRRPIVPGSETIYLDGIETTDYTLNYTSGWITFTTAPPECTDITADYTQVGYDSEADLNEDRAVDARDLALVTFNWGKQEEYPVPLE